MIFKMRKAWIGIAAVVLVSAVVIFKGGLLRSAGNDSIGDGKPVVKIGAMFPLTGDNSIIGNVAYKAFAKAIEEANDNPENRLHYKLLVEDDRMNYQNVKTIATKYVFVDKVNALITFFSTAARVVAPMAAENKIINFNLAFTKDVYKSRYNFNNYITSEAQAERIAAFFASKNIEKVTLLFQNFGGADDVLKSLSMRLEEKGITFETERFNSGERNFSIMVAKLKHSSKSQAVVINAFPPEIDILTREIRLQGIDKEKLIVLSDCVLMSHHIELYEGMYNIGSVMMSERLQKYTGLENENPAYAAYLYDTGHILVGAYEAAYKGDGTVPTSEEVADILLIRKDYSGEVGKYSLDEKGQFHSQVEVTVVENGHLVKVEF